jgi:hypothetical protein
VRFIWEEAVDLDADDVTYTLFVSATHGDIDTTVSVEGLEASEYTIERLDSLLIELGVVTEDDIRVEATWWVEASDGDLTTESSNRWNIVVPIPHEVGDYEMGIPTEFSLSPVYPNPFNPAAHLSFTLPKPSVARLVVWDGSGRLVDVIVSNELPAGRHAVTWSAEGLPTGLYIFTLEAGGKRLVSKGMLIR